MQIGAIGRVRGTLIGILGVAALYYGVGKGIIDGSLNLGGREGRAYFVTFAAQPGLFIFGLLFFLALGVGCLAVAWKAWRANDA